MGKPSQKPKRTPLPRPENPYKIVVMGEGGVGKSALSTRFVHGQFKDLWDPTIEDSFIKNITIKPNDDDLAEVHQVEIIDTAGQEEYRSISQQYYRTGKAFIFVFSIESLASFEYLKGKFEDLINQRGLDESPELSPPVVIVGNKIDVARREVARPRAEDMAQEWSRTLQATVHYMESSAKNNLGVNEIFEKSLEEILKKEQDLLDKAMQDKGRSKNCIIM